MDFYKLAASRYSVRKFAEKPLEDQKLNRILECGRIAPSAHNNQPQRIYVLKSEEALAKIRAITHYAFNAPVVLLVCGNVDEGWINHFNNRNATEMDTSIVTTHMMLQAQELGIGSTWVCWFDTEKVKQEFALPQGIEPFCLLPLGYPAENSVPTANHTTRKPLSETVTEL
jgi:nitroreductase